jgi:hypothetical protein
MKRERERDRVRAIEQGEEVEKDTGVLFSFTRGVLANRANFLRVSEAPVLIELCTAGAFAAAVGRLFAFALTCWVAEPPVSPGSETEFQRWSRSSGTTRRIFPAGFRRSGFFAQFGLPTAAMTTAAAAAETTTKPVALVESPANVRWFPLPLDEDRLPDSTPCPTSPYRPRPARTGTVPPRCWPSPLAPARSLGRRCRRSAPFPSATSGSGPRKSVEHSGCPFELLRIPTPLPLLAFPPQ